MLFWIPPKVPRLPATSIEILKCYQVLSTYQKSKFVIKVSSLRSGRDCRWGEWMFSALSTFNTMTEVRPLSKAPNPQLLPGRRSINGCPLLRVCVHGACVSVCSLLTAVCGHLDGLNAEHKFWVWVTILGHTSCPVLSFPFLSFPFLSFPLLLNVVPTTCDFRHS